MTEGFDIEAARREGYSENEILAHLSKSRNFDLDGAKREGYSAEEILRHLARTPLSQVSKPSVTPKEEPGFGSRLYDSTIAPLKAVVDRYAETPGSSPYVRATKTTGGIAGNIAQAAFDRYKENPQKTNNPFARATDAVFGPTVDLIFDDLKSGNYAGAAGTLTGGLLTAGLPKLLGKVGAKAGPLLENTSEALKSSAYGQYAKALNPTTKANKFLSSREVAPGLVDRGVTALSLKGLKGRAEGQLSRLGAAIGDAWDDLPPGSATELEPLMKKIQAEVDGTHTVEAAGKRIPKGPEARRAIANLNDLQETLLDVAELSPSTGRLEIGVDKLRSLRQYFDGVAAKSGRYEGRALADASTQEAHGLAADAIREELAKQFPDIAVINKEYSFWKNVDRVVGDTLLRREGQAKPLGQKLAAGAGAIVGGAKAGPKGAILGGKVGQLFEATVSSPGWATASAVLKDRLAKALGSGSSAQIDYYLRRIGSGARATAVAGAKSDGANLRTEGQDK